MRRRADLAPGPWPGDRGHPVGPAGPHWPVGGPKRVLQRGLRGTVLLACGHVRATAGCPAREWSAFLLELWWGRPGRLPLVWSTEAQPRALARAPSVSQASESASHAESSWRLFKLDTGSLHRGRAAASIKRIGFRVDSAAHICPA
jgi:hypothetical protein